MEHSDYPEPLRATRQIVPCKSIIDVNPSTGMVYVIDDINIIMLISTLFKITKFNIRIIGI